MEAETETEARGADLYYVNRDRANSDYLNGFFINLHKYLKSFIYRVLHISFMRLIKIPGKL